MEYFSLLCLRRETPKAISSTRLQVVIVCMFFVSIFANIGIILHSHILQGSLDFDNELGTSHYVKSVGVSGLEALLAGNISRSRASFVRYLASCLKERINLKGGIEPSFLLSALSHISSPIHEEAILKSLNWTLKQEFERQQNVFKLLSRPIINKNNYPYIHNPQDTCRKRKIDLVFAVASTPENFENRLKSRQGLKGSYSFVKNNNATLLFFIGRSNHHNKSRKFQAEINMEMRRFGDIVQEDFLDDYKNLTLKATSILKWVSLYCPHAKFVIKSFDNVGIKPSSALETLVRYRKRFGNFILGVWNTKNIVQRNPEAKNYVSFKEYPHSTFPPHLLGGAIGFPVSTAKLLYQTILRTKPLWLDDVFISGICAPLANVPVMMDYAFNYRTNNW